MNVNNIRISTEEELKEHSNGSVHSHDSHSDTGMESMSSAEANKCSPNAQFNVDHQHSPNR